MQNKKAYSLILYVFAALCLLTAFFNPGIKFAKADSVVYSDVLTDLQKDESFKAEAYQVIEDNYSLDVIHIAESVNNQLFVYVYQPGADATRKATSINISTTIDENLNYTNYSLTYLNSYQTLFKYKVNNFILLNEDVRYYDISSVYRAFDETIDEAPTDDNGNTISEVAFSVAQQWKVETVEGVTTYSCLDTEVIEITDKYVGFVRYKGGFSFADWNWHSDCDNHFVAFSTNYDIDDLLEADVYYESRSYHYLHEEFGVEITRPSISYGDKQQNYSYLKHTDVDTSYGWPNHKYKWNKIQSVDEFIANENYDNVYHVTFVDVRQTTTLTNEGLQDIKNKQWILRFTTTDYSSEITEKVALQYYKEEIKSTLVDDVSILRLKFETAGQIYNLGVVDNKQAGDGEPDNETRTEAYIGFVRKLAKIFGTSDGVIIGVLIAIVLVILLAIWKPQVFVWIGKAIYYVLDFIFKGIWWLIECVLELFEKK